MSSAAPIDWTIELQNYIRIDTSRPIVNYGPVIDYLVGLVSRMHAGLYYRIHTCNSCPILIVTKPGNTNRSILLNSHMDVVDAKNVHDWTYPPFAGYYDERTDKIHGRGTQAMKSQGMQYMAALYNLKNVQLDRTVHMTFVFDEEVSGIGGLSEFVRTSQFRNLCIDFALGESCASPFAHYLIFNTERTVWKFVIKIRADTGHVTVAQSNTCETKLRLLLNEIAEFKQRDLMENEKRNDSTNAGYITTVNLMRIESGNDDGGVLLHNVLPRQIDVFFDVRIGVLADLNAIYGEINRWVETCNNGKQGERNNVTIHWLRTSPKIKETDMHNTMCSKFITYLQDINVPYAIAIAPRSTEAHWLRDIGIPVLGFTPINLTPPLLHSENEFIFKQKYLDNIQLMTRIVQHMAII